MSGSRDNKGKLDLTLCPSELIIGAARGFTHGMDKYCRDNWRLGGKNLSVNSVMASLLRHAYKYLDGQNNDYESGLSHLDHIACNVAILLGLENSNTFVDDRFRTYAHDRPHPLDPPEKEPIVWKEGDTVKYGIKKGLATQVTNRISSGGHSFEDAARLLGLSDAQLLDIYQRDLDGFSDDELSEYAVILSEAEDHLKRADDYDAPDYRPGL